MADDVQARIAAAWRKAGFTDAADRADTAATPAPGRRPRVLGDGLSGGSTPSADADKLAYNAMLDWVGQTVSANARQGQRYDAPADRKDLYVESMKQEGKEVTPYSSYWSLAGDATRSERGNAPAPTGDESVLKRNAEAWNSLAPRQLSDAEWNQLSPTQQSSVRFNDSLIGARAADTAAGSTERANTTALYSNLDLGIDVRNEITKKLGSGFGDAVRYGDLFDSTGQTLGEAAKLPSISEKISAYVSSMANPGQAAAADGSGYTYASDTAKQDYEASFGYMLKPEVLSQIDWPTIAANMSADGYNPDDFKTYAIDRIKLLPMTEGQSSAEDIRSWFGK